MNMDEGKSVLEVKHETWKARLRLWSLFGVAVFLCLLIFVENRTVILNPQGSILTYLSNFCHGNGGLGTVGDYHNPISFSGLEAGDIVLGGYPNCGYGEYSHVALYIGDNQILEGYADSGLTVQNLSHFRTYSQVALLRVEVDPVLKAQAVTYALQKRGGAFYPLAFKKGDRVWNCSKIMWKAYAEQGIDLDPLHDLWVKPETFKDSPYVKVISEKKI